MSAYRFINVGPEGIEGNFWEYNPQLKYLEPFKTLHDEDTSKKKVESSKTMWCIWMLEDPNYENKVFQQLDQDKDEVVKNYHPKFDRDEKNTQAVIAIYDNTCLSAVGRSYKGEVRSMVERGVVLTTTAYTFDTYDIDPITKRQKTVKGTSADLDRMRLMTSKIMEGYEKIEKAFREEQVGARVAGGRNETMREKGRLRQIKEVYE